MKIRIVAGAALVALLALVAYWGVSSRTARIDFTGWTTDTTRAEVDFDELVPGCPARDCIASIDAPAFTSVAEADARLHPRAPVAVVAWGGEVRAYPLQILARHEIVNDVVGGEPLAVTYCPLWDTALAFRRTLTEGEAVTFGVSGVLRHRNLVMYDRSSESLWLQATGEGVVGAGAGRLLEMTPVQVLSWADFKALAPDGGVLARPTGVPFDYDLQPYAGYDDPRDGSLLPGGDVGRDGLRPMDRVVAMEMAGDGVAVPFRALREAGVVQTPVGGDDVVVFWAPGTATVLDRPAVADSRDVGSVGAFRSFLDGQRLTFESRGEGRFQDSETGSVWDVAGVAVEGPLAGARLEAVVHTSAFWFGWREFRPDTRVVGG